MVLVDLHWTDWGDATAHATGALRENPCVPDCASSHGMDTYRASVTVSGLAHGHYTQLRIVAPGAPNQPYDLPLTTPNP